MPQELFELFFSGGKKPEEKNQEEKPEFFELFFPWRKKIQEEKPELFELFELLNFLIFSIYNSFPY